MLQKLHIQNYAIIDEITILFPGKLSIITGETGAGKSILMGALGLILGGRADSQVLWDKTKKSVVEGVFSGDKSSIKEFLETNDLDLAADLVIRREIAANGKSRAFVNDTPVNLSQLQELSSLLVDLHQQFDTMSLGESDFQREVLDALAAHGNLLQEYSEAYRKWNGLNKKIIELKEEKARLDSAYDYNNFLYTEIEQAGLKENEMEDAEAELKLLNSAEGIKAALDKIAYELNDADNPLIQQLKTMTASLQSYTAYHSGLEGIAERLQSAYVELKDIAEEVQAISEGVQYDARRIDWLNEKISVGYRLLKKHNLQHTHELLTLKSSLQEKLLAVTDLDDLIAGHEKELIALRSNAGKLARQISLNRQKEARPLEEKVNKLLAQVGMPNARLKVVLQQQEDLLKENGIDTIEFLFDANKSNQFASIRKVASGGELSRLMLCIKSLVAQSIDLPTMIFDEIDTGISGEAARQVGIILKELSLKRQIICITHQPQIAGKADAHFYVFKQIEGDAVKTNIRLLTREERINAIAQMLSGEKPTAAALENAREMVMN